MGKVCLLLLTLMVVARAQRQQRCVVDGVEMCGYESHNQMIGKLQSLQQQYPSIVKVRPSDDIQITLNLSSPLSLALSGSLSRVVLWSTSSSAEMLGGGVTWSQCSSIPATCTATRSSVGSSSYTWPSTSHSTTAGTPG